MVSRTRLCEAGALAKGFRVDRWAAVETQAQDGEFDAALRPASAGETLCDGPRQFFVLAAEVARGRFEPTVQWDEFVQALWEQVDAGFALTADEENLESPLVWFEEPGDEEVVVWDARPDKR